MSQQVKTVLRQNAPWSATVHWWVVLLEGALAVAMGIYFLNRPHQAAVLILFVIGAYLFLSSLVNLVGSFKRSGQWPELLRFGIGLVVGVLMILQPFTALIDVNTARMILSGGLILSGLLAIYQTMKRERGGHFHWGLLLIGLLNIVLGLILFSSVFRDNALLPRIGWAAIIFGIILLPYALVLRSNARERTLARQR